MKITKEDRAWTAAVIDCEGCLCLGSYRLKRNSNTFGHHCHCRVQMCNEEIPKKLYKLWGGWFSNKTWAKGNRKPYFTWHCYSGVLRILLPEIFPYLIAKKKHAKLLLEYLSMAYRGWHNHDHPRLIEIKKELKILNKRGKNRSGGFWAEPIKK